MGLNFDELTKGDKKTLDAPGDDPEAKVKKHVPVVAVDGKKVKVTVGHGMADDHWIDGIWIVSGGAVLFSKDLSASDAPEIEFTVADGVTEVVAYEHCNLHGTYASASVSIA